MTEQQSVPGLPVECPRCHSIALTKVGCVNGSQKYKCQSCGYIFVAVGMPCS